MPGGASVALPSGAGSGQALRTADYNPAPGPGTARRRAYGEATGGSQPRGPGGAHTRFRCSCGSRYRETPHSAGYRWHPNPVYIGAAVARGIDFASGVAGNNSKNVAYITRRGKLSAGAESRPPKQYRTSTRASGSLVVSSLPLPGESLTIEPALANQAYQTGIIIRSVEGTWLDLCSRPEE
jgi:hypothetical protein